jgi:hypothetical protein
MPVVSDVVRYISSRLFQPYHPLIDRGFGLIYDVERDLTWLKDANFARTSGRSPDGQLTWFQARAWVSSLSYYGVRGWRLPSALNPDGSGPCIGQNCKHSELGHLIFEALDADPGRVQFLNFQNNAKYWNWNEASGTEAYGWDFFSLRQGTLLKDPSAGGDLANVETLTGPILTWPVHDGDVSAIVVRRLFTFGIGARSTVLDR